MLFTLAFPSGRFSSGVASGGALVSFTGVASSISSSAEFSNELTAEYALKPERFSSLRMKLENLKPGFRSCGSSDMAV